MNAQKHIIPPLFLAALSLVLAVLFSRPVLAQNNAQADSAQQADSAYRHLPIMQTDLTKALFMVDSICYKDSVWDDDYENLSPVNRCFPLPDPLGFIGSNYQRFFIHFDSIAFLGNGAYFVWGRTKMRNHINSFSGTMQIDSVRYFEPDTFENPCMEECGYIKLSYSFVVEEKKGHGILEGKSWYDFIIEERQFHYSTLYIIADGYENGQYQGTYRHPSGRVEKCNWGHFRIPDSGPLDNGCGVFVPHEKYRRYGWDTYNYGLESDCDWWKNSPK